jgi:hypothetical protein
MIPVSFVVSIVLAKKVGSFFELRQAAPLLLAAVQVTTGIASTAAAHMGLGARPSTAKLLNEWRRPVQPARKINLFTTVSSQFVDRWGRKGTFHACSARRLHGMLWVVRRECSSGERELQAGLGCRRMTFS